MEPGTGVVQFKLPILDINRSRGLDGYFYVSDMDIIVKATNSKYV